METESVILDYAKKIYGFAYSKTKNTHNAEDLSQEIILQLLDGQDFARIENMDAYIYRICCYTWSHYLRKNKPAWNMVGLSEEALSVHSDSDIEKALMDRELYETLRREVMYLSRMRREITILYYYENKSGDEIATLLGIPASTVRWHMKETKTILKERLEMKETNDIYTPQKLSVGHCGWAQDYNMSGLCTDLIMQNICILCREKPLSIEEIARTMGIAAVYLENKIETLLYMDYLKAVGVGKNKYQTTFYISDTEDFINDVMFHHNHGMDAALPILDVAKKLMQFVNEENLLFGNFSDDYLLYALLVPVSNELTNEINRAAMKKLNLRYDMPKRKDGSQHLVSAAFYVTIPPEIKKDKVLYDHCRNFGGSGCKTRMKDGYPLFSIQMDLCEFGGWRSVESDDLAKACRVYDLMKRGGEISDYDKEAIADLCRKGYVRTVKEKPQLLVPVLELAGKYGCLYDLIKDAAREEMEAFREKLPALCDLVLAEKKKSAGKLPKGLGENERNYHLSCFGAYNNRDIIHILHRNGYLYTPTVEERKSICTLLYTH